MDKVLITVPELVLVLIIAGGAILVAASLADLSR